MACEATIGELFRAFFSEEEQEHIATRLRAGLITLQEISNTVFLLEKIEKEDWPGLKSGSKALLTGIDMP